MGFLDNLAARLRPAPRTKASIAGPLIAWSGVGQPKWSPRNLHSLAEEGFRKNTVAYRCVMAIATSAASVPWLAYDENGHELDQHPLLNLLRRPNPLQDGVAFMENVYANLEISGNAFVEAVMDDDGAPVELYVLRPDRMKVIPGPNGLPQGYQYSVNGQVTTWAADPISGASPILHLKLFHPLDDWYGLAPMEAALLAIDQHNAAGAWNQSLLNQGARPSGALVYAPKDGPATLTDEQMTRLREEMTQLYQGNRNAGRPLVLEGGLEWREMSLSPKDMDWLAGRDAAARDIALAFGVPAQLIGMPGAQTYANMAEARLAFYEETVLPRITRVIAGFDHWLASMFDEPLELDFDADSISALSVQQDMQWSKLQSVSFLTPNEKREAAGYPPLPGGDRLAGVKAAPRARRKPAVQASHLKDTDDDDVDFATDAIDNGNDVNPLDTWHDLDTLQGHFEKHGDEFGATLTYDYADRANQFYDRFQNENLPAYEDYDGTIGAYHPPSNSLGRYTPEGDTITFFKPKEGQSYFEKLNDNAVGRGGRTINSLDDCTPSNGISDQIDGPSDFDIPSVLDDFLE